MLLGCCHCGSPPSESTPPSTSQSLPPSTSESITSVSEVSNDCISVFGCSAVPRRLKFQVAVGGGDWDGSPDCLCSHYDGTFTLNFCTCLYSSGSDSSALIYSTNDRGWWRTPNPLVPNAILPGCSMKAVGDCTVHLALNQGQAAASSRLYYAVIRPSGIQVLSSSYFTFYLDGGFYYRATVTRTWKNDGIEHNCLTNGPWVLPSPEAGYIDGVDGCIWGAGTLSVA